MKYKFNLLLTTLAVLGAAAAAYTPIGDERDREYQSSRSPKYRENYEDVKEARYDEEYEAPRPKDLRFEEPNVEAPRSNPLISERGPETPASRLYVAPRMRVLKVETQRYIAPKLKLYNNAGPKYEAPKKIPIYDGPIYEAPKTKVIYDGPKYVAPNLRSISEITLNYDEKLRPVYEGPIYEAPKPKLPTIEEISFEGPRSNRPNYRGARPEGPGVGRQLNALPHYIQLTNEDQRQRYSGLNRYDRSEYEIPRNEDLRDERFGNAGWRNNDGYVEQINEGWRNDGIRNEGWRNDGYVRSIDDELQYRNQNYKYEAPRVRGYEYPETVTPAPRNITAVNSNNSSQILSVAGTMNQGSGIIDQNNTRQLYLEYIRGNPLILGRFGLGYDKRTATSNGLMRPLTSDQLQVVGKNYWRRCRGVYLDGEYHVKYCDNDYRQ